MIWKAKPKPEAGDIKYVRKFAIFPILLTNRYYIWFDFYYSKMEYQTRLARLNTTVFSIGNWEEIGLTQTDQE